MDELPVIGFLCLRQDFWDRQGQTLQFNREKCMAKCCFDVKKKTILVRDHRFFAAESKKIFAHVLLSNQIGNSGSGLYYS